MRVVQSRSSSNVSDDVGAVTPPREPRWHPVLTAAFAALDRAGVTWCLLRPPDDPGRPTGDVDLLVQPRSLGRVPAVLAEEGLARVPDAGTPDHFYLRYDPDTDCWIYLHVTSRVAFGPLLELDTGTAPACLARRRRIDDAWRLDADDEFWATLLHGLLDKDEVGASRQARLEALGQDAGPRSPIADVLAGWTPREWPVERFLTAVREGAWGDVRRGADLLRARWRAGTAAERRATRLQWGLRLARGVGNPWRRRGLSVALLGPDGAGKSTLAEGLREHFFFPTDSYYMDVKDHELERVRRVRVPGLTFAAYMGILSRRLLVARLQQARGHLVVFDRYSYDALVDAPKHLPVTRRLARLVHTRLLPPAGMVLVLDLPGEVMFARKGERNPADLEAERQRLLRLGERVPNVGVVDAARPADAVRRESTARIWEHYARRWGARSDGFRAGVTGTR